MGVAVDVLGVETDERHQLLDALEPALLVDAVHAHRVGDDRVHRHARVERCVGILEDDLHLAALPSQVAPAERQHVDTVEQNRARRCRQ